MIAIKLSQKVSCNNGDCNWTGTTSEACMLGAVGPLCPLCRETTEPDDLITRLAAATGFSISKYGCFDRQQYMPAITVFDGYTDRTRTQAKTKDVPNRMQQECQYTHSESGGVDPKCDGCKHRGKI